MLMLSYVYWLHVCMCYYKHILQISEDVVEEYWPSEESEPENEDNPHHNNFTVPPIQHFFFLLFCGNSYIASQFLQWSAFCDL